MTSYQKGFLSGLYWPDRWDHKPGGPWVYSGKNNKELAEKSRQEHDDWMQAWELGNDAKAKMKLVNEFGTPEENQRAHFAATAFVVQF